VNFFLQVNADGAIRTNNFVGANSGGGRDIAARVGNAYILRNLAHAMIRALDRGSNQTSGELSTRRGPGSLPQCNLTQGQREDNPSEGCRLP
jgi:hypothetical protein